MKIPEVLKKIIYSKIIVSASRDLRVALTRLPFPVTFKKRIGRNWVYIDLRTSIGREILISGDFDPEVFKAIKAGLKPGATYIDIGANIGYYVFKALDIVGKSGNIHAFEVDPRPLQLLNKSLDINNISNCFVHKVALGNKNGTGYFDFRRDSGHSGLTNDESKKVVQMRTLDSRIEGQGVSRIDVIKIDVEGGEYAVLNGAEKTLLKYKPLIVCEVADDHLESLGLSKDVLLDYLSKLNYSYEFVKDAGTPTITATYNE